MFSSVQLLLLLICISYGKCQNSTENLKKENIFVTETWTLRRFTKITGEDAVPRYRLNCKECLKNKDWNGLKLDIYFRLPIKMLEIKKFRGDKYIHFENHLRILISNVSAVFEDREFFEFSVLLTDQTAVERTVETFYVNEEYVAGYRKKINYETQGIDLLGRRDCSFYIRLHEGILTKEATITFAYFNEDFYEGLNLTLIFQQVLKSVQSKSKKLHASPQEGNQWTLQNFGLEVQEKETVMFEIELEAEDLLLSLYPLAIVLNGKLLCGLPIHDLRPGTAIVSYKEFSQFLKLTENNYGLLISGIALTSIVCLLVFGVISLIIYMSKSKGQQSWYRYDDPQCSVDNNSGQPIGQHNQRNNFHDFVNDADYVNVTNFL